jgi:hypothetical protein
MSKRFRDQHGVRRLLRTGRRSGETRAEYSVDYSKPREPIEVVHREKPQPKRESVLGRVKRFFRIGRRGR